MQLTAENVHNTLMDCLFKSGEDTTLHKVGEGVMTSVGLHPDRLEAKRTDIENMLSELPEQFMVGVGGGWSFMNACVKKDGNQWADTHQAVDKLVMLGNALGRVQFTMPRELWSALPGGLPYFSVNLQ